ncbi:MAG: lipopolysaccharide biosynthesis protein RfbH [Anaerolineales bacterium]|nr:lipopolysaccharide biosynthesis protein RfbH [Anaerolineales bacterium]
MDINDLRKRIFQDVAEYQRRVHAQQPFIPGETKIQYGGRVFDEQELVNMVDSVLEFWITAGRFAQDFEQKLAEFLDVKQIIPVNSGSSANLVAISALCSRRLENGLRPGDEVITPAAAFPTTVAPILQNQLVPVFVDCQMGTYNLDPDQLETALSPRSRAIFFAHTLGNPAEMDAIEEFAKKHNLLLIEDCCDSLGTRYDGRMVGAFGQAATLSFYPAHHITTGEGGAVYTNNDQIARLARTFRDWGRDCYCGYNNPPEGECGQRFRHIPGLGFYDHRYVFSEIGYNLKITDVQAAIGVAQLVKLPDFIAARKHNFEVLYRGLEPFRELIELPRWSSKADPSWFAFPITVPENAPFSREELTRFLESKRIETRVLFAGNILQQPGFRDIPCRVTGELPITNNVMKGAFFIGVYPGLDEVRLAYMLEQLHTFLNQYL